MITISSKVDCCGCWACYNVCPKKSISMEEDNEGFRYPVVDVSTCIECGQCEKVCPIINVKPEIAVDQSAILLQHKDAEVLKESTSGGAFTAIGEWVINQGGVVFGAAFERGTFTVKHQYVERVEELAIYRNSKYVQSLIGDTYAEAKRFLAEGRIVCFSGTPCQIEGLVAYLRKPYENLLLIDVVCRAVPSPLLLRKYLNLKEQTNTGKYTKLYFREKYYGYKYSTFSLYNTDSKQDLHSGIESNYYLRSFFSGMAVRPSCTDCKFKKRYRQSDITIWDCFDVYKFSKEFDDDRGVTRCLIHSALGTRVASEIGQSAKIMTIDTEAALEGVREMYHSVAVNPRRESFFNDLNSLSEQECFDKYFPITIKSRVEKFIRKTMNRLGLYAIAKRTFKALFPKQAAIKN
ncbi:MAG: Coenzyme F420 hydrogenase/dehydrogenase, beta subunit C-terminal domain [Rikenellaceae bacterium]